MGRTQNETFQRLHSTYYVLAPTCSSRPRSSFDVIFGPLLQRMYASTPSSGMAPRCVSMTSTPFQVTHDPDRKAPPGVPVVQGHQPQAAPVMGGMMDKVVRPEMAGMRRTQEPSVSPTGLWAPVSARLRSFPSPPLRASPRPGTVPQPASSGAGFPPPGPRGAWLAPAAVRRILFASGSSLHR